MDAATKTCPNCGIPNKDDAFFCGRCGTKLQGPPVAQGESVESELVSPRPSPKPSRRSTYFAIASLIAVSVLIGIILLYPNVQLNQSPAVSTGVGYGNPVVLFRGGTAPVGVAVDKSGTVYWTNYDSGQLLSLALGASSPTAVLSGLNHPSGVAVDSSGNLYYDESFPQTVSELPAGSTSPRVLFNAGGYATFMALDTSGNIYVVEGPQTCNGQGGGTSAIVRFDRLTLSVSTVVSDSGGIGGVFVTPAGDLYYTTCSGNVMELLGGGSSRTIVNGLGPSTGVAVDSQGNIFYTQYSSGVYEIQAGSSSPVTLTRSGGLYYGLTIGTNGNLYYTDNLGGTIGEIPMLGSSGGTSNPSTIGLTSSTAFLFLAIAVAVAGIAIGLGLFHKEGAGDDRVQQNLTKALLLLTTALFVPSINIYQGYGLTWIWGGVSLTHCCSFTTVFDYSFGGKSESTLLIISILALSIVVLRRPSKTLSGIALVPVGLQVVPSLYVVVREFAWGVTYLPLNEIVMISAVPFALLAYRLSPSEVKLETPRQAPQAYAPPEPQPVTPSSLPQPTRSGEGPSGAWYLVPILLGILGGIIGYLAVKDRDQGMANGLLVIGILVTFVALLLLIR